jgi:hypothetical protein
MVAGCLAKAGFFMGAQLYPPRESNPKGFFEDPEINGINESLLARVLPKRPPLLGQWFFRDRPIAGQMWLARIPVGTLIPSTPEIAERIRKVTTQEPYCFKDPRFAYTLPIWRPFLKNTVFVCIFRDPAATAHSILKECKDSPVLQSFAITRSQVFDVWTLMYKHILEIHRHDGAWLFVHYDQVLHGECLDRLEAFVDARVDRLFPEPWLRRSFSDNNVPDETRHVYQRLCKLAGYEYPLGVIQA